MFSLTVNYNESEVETYRFPVTEPINCVSCDLRGYCIYWYTNLCHTIQFVSFDIFNHTIQNNIESYDTMI